MKRNTRGEIATVITLGTLLIIGIVSMVSSTLLKNKQTTKSSAAESCTSCVDNKCIYHPELDPRSGNAPLGTPQCSDTGCVNDSECVQNVSCSVNGENCDNSQKCCNGLRCNSGTCEPIPVNQPICKDYTSEAEAKSACDPNGFEQVEYAGGYINNCWKCRNGKLDMSGTVNAACCSTDSDCKANGPNQSCAIPNGACQSGKSCAEAAPDSTKPKYIRMCGGAICGWTFCDGKNVPLDKCVDSTDVIKTESPWCSSDEECKTFIPTPAPGVNTCRDSALKTQSCPATYNESCGGGKSRKVHRDCTQSNTSGCIYWCDDGKDGRIDCDSEQACSNNCPTCKGPSVVKEVKTSVKTCGAYWPQQVCSLPGASIIKGCKSILPPTTGGASGCNAGQGCYDCTTATQKQTFSCQGQWPQQVCSLPGASIIKGCKQLAAPDAQGCNTGQGCYDCTSVQNRITVPTKSPIAAPTTSPVSFDLTYRNCPTSSGVASCNLLCLNSTETNLKCPNFWDKCCTDSKTADILKSITPPPAQKKVIMELPDNILGQILGFGLVVCDYHGKTGIIPGPDITNCHSIPNSGFRKDGTKTYVEFDVAQDRKQILCRGWDIAGQVITNAPIVQQPTCLTVIN